jgi:PleD family two-component response regulator
MGPTLLFVAVALALFAVIVHQRREIATLALRLNEASRVDSLTGLLNRRAFEEMLDFELDRSRRTGRPVSVIIG